ncbi:MAG: hypothetical protein EBT99_15940 [Betaproteobacteria bacterium]|nr:hypothetical protein [Betaproteobacteria bacterium]
MAKALEEETTAPQLRLQVEHRLLHNHQQPRKMALLRPVPLLQQRQAGLLNGRWHQAMLKIASRRLVPDRQG